MQSLISANEKSTTEQKMNAAGQFIPFYNPGASFPPLGTQCHKIAPYIAIVGAIANKSLSFKEIAGSGFLYGSSFGFLCTAAVTTGDVKTPDVAFRMVRSFEVLSNGNQIIYKTGEAIFAQVRKSKNKDYQQWCMRYAQMLDPTTENQLASNADVTSFLTYLPDPESYLTRPEKLLLTSVIGDLEYRITFNDATKSGLPAAVSAITAYKYSRTYMPKLSVYQQMVVNDWSRLLSLEMVNTYTEETTLTTDTTLSNYVFTVPYLVARTHVFIKDITNNAADPYTKIDTVSNLTIGGVPYINDWKASRVKEISAWNSVGSTSVNTSDALVFNDDVLTIEWGVLCGTDMNSGTAFFQQLRGTTISLSFPDPGTGSEHRIFFVHEYYQIVDYVPYGNGGANGYLMVSDVS